MTVISDLDSILQHFVKLYNEKRAALEEEQLHLNVGLNKIDETVEQVLKWVFYPVFDSRKDYAACLPC